VISKAPIRLDIRAIREAEPGPRLRALFEEYWPAYRAWMRRAPPLEASVCRGAVAEHMPEIVPVLDRICELVGGDDEVARFLSLHRPPRLVRACSQVVLHDDEGPALLRTYDHAPHLCDGVLLSSAWLGRETMAMTDCLWGALDGLNEAGLAVALAFGGRHAVGPGFGAPLIVRYLLDTCETTSQARKALARLPVYMAYTFVVVDRSGDMVTAMLGPDRAPELRATPASTNHHRPGDWPAYRRFSASAERLAMIENLLIRRESVASCLSAFLQPPIWRTEYRWGSGSLYASLLRPQAGTMELHWPGRCERFGFGDFAAREFAVELKTP